VVRIDAIVRAAGGLVYRRDGDDLRLLLVHRPRYDDWTFPKGKAHEDESDEECAVREVSEETGLQVELEDELATTEYTDGHGRSKRVRYWLMRPVSGSFTPTEEVDEIRWCSRAEAATILSYERDVALLASVE
jgi:8-oxo-dGTP diphosphatase